MGKVGGADTGLEMDGHAPPVHGEQAIAQEIVGIEPLLLTEAPDEVLVVLGVHGFLGRRRISGK